MTKKALESWEKDFQKQFEGRPKEAGELVGFIRSLIEKVSKQSFEDGKLNGYTDACSELKERCEKVREETLSEVRSKLPEERKPLTFQDDGYNICLKEIKNLI